MDVVTSRFDLRVGAARLVWGRLDEFQPTDVVNPIDLSRFLMEGRSEARLSVGLVRGRVFLPRSTTVEAVVVPAFRRGRFDQVFFVDLPLDVAFRGTPPKGSANLSVLVTREDGSPVQATVTIRRLGSPVGLTAETDETGTALFSNVTAGFYQVEASASLLGAPFYGTAAAQADINRVTFVHLIVHRIF